jgi:hypothetical protein
VEAYRRSSGTAPHTLFLDTRWRCAVKFSSHPLYPREITLLSIKQGARWATSCGMDVSENKMCAAPAGIRIQFILNYTNQNTQQTGINSSNTPMHSAVVSVWHETNSNPSMHSAVVSVWHKTTLHIQGVLKLSQNKKQQFTRQDI